MRYDNKFTDVTLVWEDGQLGEAHQVILAGWSPHTNTPTLSSGLDDSSSDDRKDGKLFTKLLPGRLSVMYRLFHNRVYLVSEAWKIIHKVGSKTVLMQLFYYDQKDSVCIAGGVEAALESVALCIHWSNYYLGGVGKVALWHLALVNYTSILSQVPYESNRSLGPFGGIDRWGLQLWNGFWPDLTGVYVLLHTVPGAHTESVLQLEK